MIIQSLVKATLRRYFIMTVFKLYLVMSKYILILSKILIDCTKNILNTTETNVN